MPVASIISAPRLLWVTVTLGTKQESAPLMLAGVLTVRRCFLLLVSAPVMLVTTRCRGVWGTKLGTRLRSVPH